MLLFRVLRSVLDFRSAKPRHLQTKKCQNFCLMLFIINIFFGLLFISNLNVQSFPMLRASPVLSRISQHRSFGLKRLASSIPLSSPLGLQIEVVPKSVEVSQWKGDMIVIPQFKLLSKSKNNDSSEPFKLCETGKEVDAQLDGAITE